MKLLLEKYKAPTDIHDENGLTALHMSCYNGHLEVVKLLLKQGANVHALDTMGLYVFLVNFTYQLEMQHIWLQIKENGGV